MQQHCLVGGVHTRDCGLSLSAALAMAVALAVKQFSMDSFGVWHQLSQCCSFGSRTPGVFSGCGFRTLHVCSLAVIVWPLNTGYSSCLLLALGSGWSQALSVQCCRLPLVLCLVQQRPFCDESRAEFEDGHAVKMQACARGLPAVRQ